MILFNVIKKKFTLYEYNIYVQRQTNCVRRKLTISRRQRDYIHTYVYRHGRARRKII